MSELYAVVKWSSNDIKFSKWHDSYDLAKKEAERLCKREQIPFFILKSIAHCQMKETPIEWVEEYVNPLPRNMCSHHWNKDDPQCVYCGIDISEFKTKSNITLGDGYK